ncbi:uncharacterized protein A1O9_06308 [Exophiala aquamarina CBS 119918]|uniref:Uncharacterized protein n=1 Tax=Exophiala aquamarina CBS 119918 TaxID=1182545 RepID=A0A072PF54_9EURO|nr:uncharacterized protein A1O9_06308 [Exophiala aquamarina CBS 119918]KEF58382.1 hypothetical protein A1O9_06308 [Exophiala aquamarina CBS 119918]
MNSLIERLDELIEDTQTGARSSSALSGHVSNISTASSASREDIWQALRRDLEGLGVSSIVLSEQRDYIVKWLMNAVAAGRVELDSPASELAPIVDMSSLMVDEPTSTVEEGDFSWWPRRKVVRERPVSQHLYVPTNGPKHKSPSWIKQIQHSRMSKEKSLHAAIKSRDVSKIEEFLAFPLSVASACKLNESAVSLAVSNGDEEILQLLMERGRWHPRNSDEKYWLERHLEGLVRTTASNGPVSLLGVLLENGLPALVADFRAACSSRNTATAELILQKGGLENDEISPFLCEAAYNEYPEMFQLLLRYGANIHTKNDFDLFDYFKNQPQQDSPLEGSFLRIIMTPLHFASAVRNTHIIQLALSHGAHIDEKDNFGETPLHKATGGIESLGTIFHDCRRRVVRTESMREPGAAIELLLGKGADVDAKTMGGQTALHLAAKYNALSAIGALLAGNARISAVDHRGNSPLHHAASLESLYKKKVPLTQIAFAASELKLGYVEESRVYFGGEGVMSHLLAKGAPVDQKNSCSRTPLHLAARQGNDARSAILLNHGADVNATDNGGWTPLHGAIEAGAIATVRLLLSNGAATNTRAIIKVGDGDGSQTRVMDALQHARHLKAEAIVQILIDANLQ